ncbi:hypothetical protein VIGAN_04098500 [Vigna angularis var. angularis]|uniref:Uncharacterized protein n=1 Tax=Vigna angularis var. angularis TaxID=157739 RepID=A0A0S3RT37_PHAAN|nr:hypothetical protein VIGAN_04098500 [Vigna angularis var. angularis]
MNTQMVLPLPSSSFHSWLFPRKRFLLLFFLFISAIGIGCFPSSQNPVNIFIPLFLFFVFIIFFLLDSPSTNLWNSE